MFGFDSSLNALQKHETKETQKDNSRIPGFIPKTFINCTG